MSAIVSKVVWHPIGRLHSIEVHVDGMTVQAVRLKGSDNVNYAFRRDGETGWFGHATERDVTLEEFAARFTGGERQSEIEPHQFVGSHEQCHLCHLTPNHIVHISAREITS